MLLFWRVVLLLGLAFHYTVAGVPSSISNEEHLTAAASESIAEELSREYMEFMRTGVESQRLQELGAVLRTSHSEKDIFTHSLAELTSTDQFFICTMCRATVNVISRTFTAPGGELNGPSRDEITKGIVVNFCDYFSITTPQVCAGLFDLNWPIIDYIMNETIANSRSLCGMLPIPICEVEQPEFNLTIAINGVAPTESNSVLAERSENDLRILHLTDIHYDPEYLVGGQGDCREPMCCRNPLPEGSTSEPAGYWSDYRDCDTPRHMIINALEHIRDTQKVDFVIHTGDVPPHNTWSTTKQGNIEILTEIDDLLTEYFPQIPVYSCIANHEPHPTNVFDNHEAPDEISMQWLYDHVWTLWAKWLPAEAEATVRKGGYFTVSPSPGHRIISLNSQDCYLFNWWVFYNGSIAAEQLVWFHDTLLAAEAAGEHVTILSHIPSGNGDCWSEWAREYNRIVERFSETITANFNGHTHKDEMNLHYTVDGKPFSISWNGGSLTSYSYKNPNYRIYEVNRETWQVVEHETWIFNLTAANLGGQPNWYKEYEFTKEFTTDTSPAGIDRLLIKMAEEPELLRKFWRYKMTEADPMLEAGCDHQCLLSTICSLATTNFGEKTRCRELRAILQESLDKETPPSDDDEDDDGGAASLVAFSVATIMGIFSIVNLM